MDLGQKKLKNILKPKHRTALDAVAEAQRIAFAPIIFQAVRALRNLGVLSALDSAGETGKSIEAIANELDLSQYGVRTLIESGVSVGVVECIDDNCFALSKVGHFLLHDRMTRVNMDFNHFVCYLGMYRLDEAVAEGRPAGLRAIDANHSTVYEALPHLPDDIKAGWYAFDHFYSDSAYPAALEIILERQPETLVDIGANQGRFSILAAQTDDSLQLTMIDLPDQLAEAVSLVGQAGFGSRVDALGMDVLQPDAQVPRAQCAYWLSQVLCCFSEAEIESLLRRLVEAMAVESRLYVLETCWDRQQFEAAAFSLINTSPYFTCIANGNSKMYTSNDLLGLIERSGLRCDRTTDGLGTYHTLFECSKAPESAA